MARSLPMKSWRLPCGESRCLGVAPSLPAFAFIIAMFWRLAPAVLWLWCALFGGMWFLINGLQWRLFSAIRMCGRVKSMRRAPATPPIQRLESTGDKLELEKAWHGLHYLLTGSDDDAAEPLGYLLSGGEDIGDLPASPARLLNPQQVRHFYEAMLAITPDELRLRFDAEKMTALEIYPNVWDRPGEVEWLAGTFERMRTFLQEQVSTGDRSLIITLG